MNRTQAICTQEPKTIIPQINAQEINGMLYFMVERGNNSKEYWKTNGTPNGTVFIAKI